jgi:hypothetical protein
MIDDEIIALAHKYIEFEEGKIDGATLKPSWQSAGTPANWSP